MLFFVNLSKELTFTHKIMKKHLLLFFIMALLPLVASAYDAYINGIYYNFSGNEATVTRGEDEYSNAVIIPESVTYEGKNYRVTNIGEDAFAEYSSLTSVIIPNSVTNIGSGAFAGGCDHLTSVTIGDGVINIGNSAFVACWGLTSIKLPNNVTFIGEGAFRLCSGLTEIAIPHGVTSIGSEAFANCSSLRSVTSNIHNPFATGNSAFAGIPSDATLYVPAGTKSKYQALADWNRFTNIEESGSQEPEAYAVLSADHTTLSFYYDGKKDSRQGTIYTSDQFGTTNQYPRWIPNSFTTVVFDDSFAEYDGVTSTYRWFFECTKLTTIVGIKNLNTKNVTSMNNMFAYCFNLTGLDVSHFNTANVKDMSGMFYSCRSLASLDVSAFNTTNVTDMSTMFFGCSGLTSLDVSSFNTANVIGMSYMFYECNSLVTIIVGDNWNTDKVTNSDYMFAACISLVGGDGTIYSADYTDKTKAYAGPGGYLTKKEEIALDYDWSIGPGGDFADIYSAMHDDRVKDGAVLHVLPATNITGSSYITKAVTIVGNGYKDMSDGYINNIYIDNKDVTLKSLYTGSICIRHNNTTIERCRTGSITGAENYESEEVTIRGCFVLGWVCSYSGYIASDWTLSNNIIIATNYNGNALDYLDEATIDHNLIINYNSNYYAVGASVINSFFTNNIMLEPTNRQGINPDAVSSADKFEYNIVSNSGSFANWATNKTGYTNMSQIFACKGERTTDTYYRLIYYSPAKGYANDGGDCGPWSGAFPYILQWKLDPTLTTNTESFDFATLEALLDFMRGREPNEDMLVRVADATYTMDLLSYSMSLYNYNYNNVEELLSYLEGCFADLEKGLWYWSNSKNFNFSMEASGDATFIFYLRYSQTYQYILTFMAEKAQEMLAQGMSQEEVTTQITAWIDKLSYLEDRCKESMKNLVSHIALSNITIFIDPDPDPTHWKLNPILTTNPEQFEFATLDALIDYLLNHTLEKDVTVNVADATYNMDVLSYIIGNINANYSNVDEMLNYMDERIKVMLEKMLSMVKMWENKNITICMKAPLEAIFQFDMQYDQISLYFHNLLDTKVQQMLVQGMSQDAVNNMKNNYENNIANKISGFQEIMQTLVNHVITTNISITFINGYIPPIPDPIIDPDDLLSLKNIYNILGGSNWTSKKWKVSENKYDSDYAREDFPGVVFDDEGYVLQISLENNNLRGSINPNPNNWRWLLGLPRLTGLYMQKNNISGDLSPWLNDENRGDRLKALDMSYNNLTGISDTIPSSITSLFLENQNREWYRPNGVSTDPLKIEAMANMTPMRLYLSAKQKVAIPSLFTYDRQTQTHSARPYIYIINADGTNKYGYFTSSSQDTYSLTWEDMEYTEKQNAPCYVRFENPFNGSVYPAYIRYINGDADMSGYTDVLDVQTTLKYVLMGGGEYQFNRSAANTYEDNQINVQDIVCMVNIVLSNVAVADSIILSQNNSRRLSRAADDTNVQAWLYTEQGRIMLTTSSEMGAIDLELKGVSTSQVSLLLNHSQYQMIGRDTEQGSRYVIFSPTGQPIPASEEVALLAVSAQTELLAAQAADMEAQEMALAIGQPTGLAQVLGGALRATFQGDDLVVTISTDVQDLSLNLYTTGGQVVLQKEESGATRGELRLQAPAMPGAYILEMTTRGGGRKIVKLMKR